MTVFANAPLTPLLLRAVRPIGFDRAATPANAQMDILIGADGCVEACAPRLDTVAAQTRIIDGDGAWISPGWTDLHTHVWYGGTDISIKPTLVDAGSAGEANFHGLREWIIDRADEEIYAFLNIGSIGLVACNRISELSTMNDIDVDRIAATVEANRDRIVGLKVRASGVISKGWDLAPLKLGKKLGRVLKLPVMVHVGEPLPLYDDVLSLLGEGDIITHCFNGKIGGFILEDEDLFRLVEQARDRWIVLDVGHGGASFSFEVARAALSRQLLPQTISTDIHGHSIDGSVWDFPTTLSKLLALGMPLEQVIIAASTAPRRAINRPYGELLAVGSRANFTLFHLLDDTLRVKDSKGVESVLHQVFDPRYAVIGARAWPSSRYRPQVKAHAACPHCGWKA
ncbi:amidohydrolase/deacetylase family metallohydrolase [Candidatus Sodalis endolongispinus]|uniref:Amidohydrolase/deacetylase family metallohydrolase n=1 Tax=Candidatus Sodalis endolongispinus TaxID=2812662 RepID=A0ABS5YD35_9GAMM|nr:amidohydrolase/deacetylase family metallohydrolase [Candidatus Sodalis endolongispinus]MBT9432874.1 amidohydrolase/deacetylase family metallohydrolase [Candidatus Sodalis endolongispinus]